MQTVVLFYSNGEHEVVEAKTGINFTVNDLVNGGVECLFVAKNKSDANIAIQSLSVNKNTGELQGE